MTATVDWYKSHDAWWRAVKSGAYLQYYAAQYGSRLS
jgi:dTDP-glucose 4,6-dehydratase